VIEKRFGVGFIQGPDDSRAAAEEAVRIREFAAQVPTAITAAWAEVLAASTHNAGLLDSAGLRGLAKVCGKKNINPAQLVSMNAATLTSLLGSPEFVGHLSLVRETVEAMFTPEGRPKPSLAVEKNSPKKSKLPAPHKVIASTDPARLGVAQGHISPRKVKAKKGGSPGSPGSPRARPPPVQVETPVKSMPLAELQGGGGFQAVCREYIVANGSQLPEETMRSPLAGSFRMGNLSPGGNHSFRRCTTGDTAGEQGAAGNMSFSPVGCGSPSPRQVKHPHGVAGECSLELSPTQLQGITQINQGAGEGSPFQRKALEQHCQIWTRISAGVPLHGGATQMAEDKLG